MDDLGLINWIKRCEKYEKHPYLDSVRVLTIGYGRNLDDIGISEEEANYLLLNDINKTKKELSKFDWFEYQPDGVKKALINMCFNLGITRFSGFKKMISALESKDYRLAAMEALDSKWALQVGKRSRDIANMIKEGK